MTRRGINQFFAVNGGVIAAALFAVVIIFTGISRDGIYAAQEGRTALIVRKMLQSGNYLDMQVDFGVPFEKPIGHYWCCLPFGAWFGLDGDPLTVRAELALRLPSALAALVMLAAAATLAWRIYGRRSAAISIVVLASMPTFVKLARVAHIDMLFAASFSAAMLFLYLGCFEKRRSSPLIYGFYVALAAGMLLKGPLILVLAGIVVVAAALLFRRRGLLWDIRPFSGGGLFLLLALPWYVLETWRTDGEFFQEFIINQNLRRFTGIGSTYRDGERMPLYYYFPKLVAGAFPWSLAALAALVVGFRRLVRLRVGTGTLLLLIWLISGFGFFSLAALKRGDYLLPVYPALAVLTAAAIDRAIDRMPRLNRRWRWVLVGLAGLTVLFFAANFSGVVIRVAEQGLSGEMLHVSARDARRAIIFSQFVNTHVVLSLAAAGLLLGVIWYFGRQLELGKRFQAFGVVVAVVFASYLIYELTVEPLDAANSTVKYFAASARKIIPDDCVVNYYNNRNTELIYYLDRPYRFGPPGAAGGYLLTDRRGEKRLRREQPGRWREILRTPEGHEYPAVLLWGEPEVVSGDCGLSGNSSGGAEEEKLK